MPAQPEQSESETATFTCPICLSERTHLPAEIDADEKPEHGGSASSDACDDQRPDPPGLINNQGKPTFELTVCSHKFCSACLKAYVRSKLLDGVADVPCCHFKLSDWDEDFQPCNVLIEEAELYRLIHTDCGGDGSDRDKDKWCCEDYLSASCGSGDEGTGDRNEEDADQLWNKYKKLKFDAHHGKDAVRRCPKCDEARLFDEESMKQYQSKHLTDNIAAGGPSNNGSKSPVTRWEHMVHAFRQGQRNRNDATNLATRNEKDKANPPDPKGEKEEEKEKEDFTKASNISKPSLTPMDVDEDSRSSQDGGISVECKSPEEDENVSEDVGSPSLVKSATPVVTCQSCNTEFCYFHSNAHSGKSCVEYHKNSLESDRVNVEYAHNMLHAKPCPNCGISVSKEGGCNQIKCGSCGTHFCWICSTIVDDGAFPEHFRWWNLRGCANMQLDEAETPLRCTIWGARLLSVLQIIVLGIPSLVLAVVSMVMCPCFVPGCGRTNRERVVNCVSFWGSFLSSLLLLPFTCLGMLVLSALYCFLAMIALFVKVVTSSQGGQGGNSPVPGNATAGASRTVNSTPEVVSDQVDERLDFIRELENIFERMEEGIANSSSS